MKVVIVITTINEPTEAVKSFSRLNDVSVVVVGDLKTPKNWHCDNVEYLDIDRQNSLFPELANKIPYNHYSRKNLGYLFADKYLKADLIVDTDDDNFPLDNFHIPGNIGFQTIDCIQEFNGYINIFKYFTNEFIWPRGLPLNEVHKDFPFDKIKSMEKEIGVWQSLADGDTDVDAVYRLLINKEIKFDTNKKIAVGKNTFTSFNSQSTFFYKKYFKLMYLPSTVSFRFTDILRGYVAQKLLWVEDSSLGFISPMFYQDRNEHNYIKDLESELPMMENAHKIFEILNMDLNRGDLNNGLLELYMVLYDEKIVSHSELQILSAFLREY
jgi:hypothetical protein